MYKFTSTDVKAFNELIVYAVCNGLHFNAYYEPSTETYHIEYTGGY